MTLAMALSVVVRAGWKDVHGLRLRLPEWPGGKFLTADGKLLMWENGSPHPGMTHDGTMRWDWEIIEDSPPMAPRRVRQVIATAKAQDRAAYPADWQRLDREFPV